MITHIFLDKCNTIIENSKINTGLNPVAELNAGKNISRILLHFNLDNLRNGIKNGEINVNNLRHILKMTNCGGINLPHFQDHIQSGCSVKTRAASFDIIAFKIPFLWDEGRGFDYNGDYVKESHKITSTDCSNWFQARNFIEWDEPGIFSNETLRKYNSLIIGSQHFDNGTENLEIDITEYINTLLLNEEEFYGIGLCFAPDFEDNTEENKFISFFTNHTNTFFLPYLEVVNDNVILDNRANFHIGIKNRLYFYVTDNGEYINLDELPVCTIEGKDYDVKQAGKGVYYVEVKFNKNEMEPNTILTDIWSNIILDGEEMDEVEMEFVVLPMENRISFGKHNGNHKEYQPLVYGINDSECLKIGNIKTVTVDFIEEYSYGKNIIPSFSEYRLYVKEGGREIDIFPYQQLDRIFDKHSFVINTNDLIPNVYYIDIRVKNGNTVNNFQVLEFKLVDNVTNMRY